MPELLIDDGSFDKVVVPETDTVRICRLLARKWGLLAGGSTRTALAGIRRIEPSLLPGSTVVVVSPDMGENYLESIYTDS